MHQFLNQLLAKNKKRKRIFNKRVQVCLPASSLWSWGLAQSAGGRKRVPHIFLLRATGSTGGTKVFTGRSLDGPRSSFTANH